MHHTRLAVLAMFTAAAPSVAQPFVAQDDVVVGWSLASATTTLSLFSASGQARPQSWNAFGFVQSVTWDNSGGVPHNPAGNLIGGNFGTTALGGSIYIYESGDGWAGVEALGPNVTAQNSFITLGLLTTRLGGVSVSPDNTRIAFAGYDTAQVYILEYDAANRSVTSGRQTSGLPLPLVGLITSGTAWLDNSTVLAFSAGGEIRAVDANTMLWTTVATAPGAALGGSQFTTLAYSPEVSDYVYAGYSSFDAGLNVTTNRIFVYDPATWTLVHTIDLSQSASTMREIALDSRGDLFFTTHGGIVQKLSGTRNPTSVANNSSVVFATLGGSSSFSGIDVAHAGGAKPGCYANCDQSTIAPILNIDDFTCFINEFAVGQSLPPQEQIGHYANCDGSTIAPVLNIDDFTCFINEFATGCP